MDRGRITKGNRVLCCLTNGISEADDKATPELRISSSEDITELLNKITWAKYAREG
jgi:hypothetical protein